MGALATRATRARVCRLSRVPWPTHLRAGPSRYFQSTVQRAPHLYKRASSNSVRHCIYRIRHLPGGTLHNVHRRAFLSSRVSIASYLHSDPASRLRTFHEGRDLYTVRSKLVHGEKITDDEEAAAIQLS